LNPKHPDESGYLQRPPHRFEDGDNGTYFPTRRFRLLNKLSSAKPKVNLTLFVATCASTFLTGWLQNGYWEAGFWYGGTIIAILLAHEMGHYLMCRRYGIHATLPFFIPLPLSPFGTMGAVIKMEARIPSRKALFDVAVAGPLAGLAITIPAIYYGAQFSAIVDLPAGAIYLAEPFLFAKISELAVGVLPESKTVLIHPLGYAGWAGLFVTALNLLPIGQLDGGHIVYAILGKKHKIVATLALVSFAGITIFIFFGWIVLLLLLIFFGYRHPPTLDERPLDGKRVALGILTMLVFLLSFPPEPFVFLE
jgi:membrane-associated protease RseP (regulator of RpoE activity)